MARKGKSKYSDFGGTPVNRGGAHSAGGKHVKGEAPYYSQGRNPVAQARARSIHKEATKRFSQYDTSAVRPKKSKAPKIIAIVVLAAVVAAIAWFASTRLSGCSSSGDTQQIESGVSVEVTIPEGSASSQIAQALYDAKVIASTGDFLSAVREAGAETAMKPGTYEMVSGTGYDELVSTLVAGPGFYGDRLSIPEGYSISETAAAVEEATGIAAADFEALAHQASLYASDYPFLEGVYDDSMEGFLFPKTYDVPEGATADDVIRMMLDQFAEEIDALGVSGGGAGGYSLFEIVTIASMIESEVTSDSDKANVSSVIYNRLAVPMRLQIDPTVIYALGDAYTGTLTYDDLEVDSPYNTYVVDGLPAGPINSPGAASIQAAVNPASTDYLYYLAINGVTSFFEDYETFLDAKAGM